MRPLHAGDKLPIAEDRHVIANFEDLFSYGGRYRQCRALRFFHSADNAEQRNGFSVGQRIGRFIHTMTDSKPVRTWRFHHLADRR